MRKLLQWLHRHRNDRPASDLFIPTLPDHESGVRSLVAESRGEPYHALRTLDEARSLPDGVVVFEGDYGGQIYLVVPARLVECSEETLAGLLADLDSRQWDDPDGARIYYEQQPIGAGIAGGMGGGAVADGLWLHPRLMHLNEVVQEVIAGRAPSIDRAST